MGDTFATTLNRLQSKPPTIIAYSLGAQVSISALVRSNVYTGQPVQLAVIAAATDCGFDSRKLEMKNCGNISRTYVFANRMDRAIRIARVSCRIARGRRPERFEQVAPRFPAQLGQVKIFDITRIASRGHSILKYSRLPIVKRSVNELVQMSCDAPTGPATISIGQSIEESSPEQLSNLNSGQNICVTR